MTATITRAQAVALAVEKRWPNARPTVNANSVRVDNDTIYLERDGRFLVEHAFETYPANREGRAEFDVNDYGPFARLSEAFAAMEAVQ